VASVGTKLTSGTEVAGFRIESLLAEGGMGTVYLATQLRLDREVALKVLSAERSDDPEFEERFIRESKLAALLDHPNVLPVYDAGEADGVVYLAMRYLQGGDLRRLLREQGRVSAALALDISRQIALALDAAHSAGLVHRDVKPANILLGRNDHAYLADFGLARSEATRGLTRTGVFMGTPDYASPEQLEGVRALDGRADIYSLGCVLYHCLAGQPPYVRESEVGVITAHLHDPVPQLSQLRPDLPPEIGAIVAKAMEKDRAERYGSASELARALSAALSDIGGSAANGSKPAGDSDTRPIEMAAVASAGRTKTVVDRVGAQPPPPVVAEERRHRLPSPSRRVLVGAAIALLAGAAAGIFAFGFTGPAMGRIPSVVGRDAREAEALIRSAHFNPVVVQRPDPSTPGLVYKTIPGRGRALAVGRTVKLLISTGIQVPNLAGKTAAAATRRLKDLGLTPHLVRRHSAHSRAGRIFDQSPKPGGLGLPEKGQVTLVVSSGPEKVAVPDLTGETPQQAINTLHKLGLRFTKQPATTHVWASNGLVIGQTPAPRHKVPKGRKVIVDVGHYVPYPQTNNNGGRRYT